MLSPPSLTPPVSMTPDDAAAYAELLADRLGTTPVGLRDVPAQTLHDAELALNAAPLPAGFTSGFGFKIAPVIDGQFYRADWTRSAWPADLPLAIVYTLDEGAFFMDLYDPITQQRLSPPLPPNGSALTAAVQSQVGGSAATAATVIDAYAQAAAAEGRSTSPGDLWIDIFGDRLLRNFGTRYARQLAQAGLNVRYGTYMHAVKPPGRGVPHCAELPVLFGTYGLDYYRDKVGAGAAEAQLSSEIAAAVTSFARDANDVRFASGLAWPVLQPDGAASARLGPGERGSVAIGTIPKLQQLAVWDSVLGYQV
jgi:para-nitrobenzyl esterase